MTRSITIREVAREAGVSAATVSRVLSGKGPASEGVRQQVMAAMRRLRYRPAAPALSGLTGLSHTVALLVPTLSNPFYGELAEGAEAAARRLGYHLIIISIGEDAARQREEVEALCTRGVHGFLFTTAEAQDEQILELVREGYPVGVLTREVVELEAHCVINDDFRGAMMATQHLIELGHEHIVCIAEPSAFIGAPERVRGYRTAMRQANLGESIQVVTVERGVAEDGYRAAVSVLAESEVTAVVAHNDLVAIGALQACRELGKQVPEDISIVGYDGTMLARVANPPLTSVAQPIREIGAVGVELIHQVMSSAVRSARKVVLQPTLWVGRSTASAPKRLVPSR